MWYLPGEVRRERCTVLPRRRKEMALRLLRSTTKVTRGGQQRRSSGSPRATSVTLGSVQGGGHRSGLVQQRAWRRRWLRTAGALGGFKPKRRMGEGENGARLGVWKRKKEGLAAGKDVLPVEAGGVGRAPGGGGSGWGKTGEEKPLTGGSAQNKNRNSKIFNWTELNWSKNYLPQLKQFPIKYGVE
jgi:hypothetical protein